MSFKLELLKDENRRLKKEVELYQSLATDYKKMIDDLIELGNKLQERNTELQLRLVKKN